MPVFTLDTEPDVVLQALRPLLIPVYEALEVAVPRGHQIVAENGWSNSTGHLVSILIRAEVKKILDGSNCPVEFDNTPRSLSMHRLAMEGLATKFDGITVRILKGSEIPKPSTEPRRAFYQQSFPHLWVDGQVPPIKGLIALWDCTQSGNNLRLNLCCTKDSEAEDYWMIPVPHPAEWMIVSNDTAAQVDDLDDLLDDDESEKTEEN